MKIIVVSDKSADRIQLDLIDNPVVVRWFNNCKKLQEDCPIIGMLNLSNTANIIKYSIGNELDVYKELLLSISTLKNLLDEKNITEFIFPDIPSSFNRSQLWCNDVHNLFVDISIFLEKNYSGYHHKSESWDSRVFETTKVINILIHNIEKWAYPTDNSVYLIKYNHRHLQTRFDTSYHGLKLWFEISQEEQELYHSTLKNNTFYDVVFSNEILGKTFYRGFVDNEPPNSPAVSGIDKTWGNLDIKLDSQRTKIFKDERFKNWAKTQRADIETAPLEFPVGSINTNSNLDYFIKRKNTKVVFHFVD
jgi:hypothetical protein